MPKELINPNLHVILIHYPLGLLTIGTLIELFAFLWRRSTFRAAGRWMILLGALSLVPTATSGLYAMSDVNKTSETPQDATWEEVRADSPVKGEAWEMMKQHGWFNAAGSGVILLLVVSWLAASDVFRRRMHLLYLILLLGGMAALVMGAWNGGEMVYRHGVAVEVVRESADGAVAATGSGDESVATEEQTERKTGIEYYMPPGQLHVILAGLAVSLGLAAIGLSYRAGTIALRPTPELSEIGHALNANQRGADPHMSAAQMHAMDDATVQVDVSRPPVSRFWLLGALVAIAASLSGFWFLGSDSDIDNPNDLWQMIVQSTDDGDYRRMAHVITGVGMIVLMLLLAGLARVAAARRFVLSLFILLFVGSVAAQVWLGSLLLFDTPAGSVWKFNSSAAPAPADEAPGEEKDEPATPPAAVPPAQEDDDPATAPATVPATTTAPVALQ